MCIPSSIKSVANGQYRLFVWGHNGGDVFCLLWPTVGGLRELWHVDRCLLWPTVVIRAVSAQSGWCFHEEKTCLCLRVHVGNVIVRRLTRLLNITRSTNRY